MGGYGTHVCVVDGMRIQNGTFRALAHCECSMMGFVYEKLVSIKSHPSDFAIRRMKGIVVGSEGQRSPLAPDGICLAEYALLVQRA
jgi:hypothetical protein